MDNSTLYCTSEDLFESQKEVTIFCIITGKITEHNNYYDSNANAS